MTTFDLHVLADAVLTELRGMGITDIAMLTGDREPVARNVAGALGIAEVHAGLLPEEKAEFVARWQQDHDILAFAIGGPDGLARSVHDRAQATLAFGRMTWPHRLVRVMLAEQIYRAGTILSGHPYHRGRAAANPTG